MHASDVIQHEDTSGTTRETSHCCIMRKAMSKEVGAGERFDIFLDSVSHGHIITIMANIAFYLNDVPSYLHFV